eukprot:gnl/MRDRNA2_/MRDRNA2_101969_c0_seq1.p1 gnl/MRDRNA2_/MRDRNA2_101969_c0~~gnl/MRDRNA2_/MRDRNA2_101969_c0_seq1.p1  ORF type:complete len:364 (+),score=65.93 gnl/MRDRNA2_/MRDRNA2_101969_c0_seq1:74-1165(+)
MTQKRTQVWHFFQPGTGEHKLQMDGIDATEPQILLDDQPLPVEKQHVLVAGPGGSEIEIPYGHGFPLCLSTNRPVVGRQLFLTAPQGMDLKIVKDKSSWHLLVDGSFVEEYDAAKRSSGLRDLRHMKEGSYVISTQFDAANIDLNVVRKFQFMLEDQIQEVKIAHWDSIWQVVLNLAVVERQSHTNKQNVGQMKFVIRSPSGVQMHAILDMLWDKPSLLWNYVLTVNGVDVPACWCKHGGTIDCAPTVIPVSSDHLPKEGMQKSSEEDASTCSTEDTAEGTPELSGCMNPTYATPAPDAPPHKIQDVLPQGVSFDAQTGLFQAIIKSKAGRFVFLGEFTTPEEAHERYLEGIPTYCPDKKIAR